MKKNISYLLLFIFFSLLISCRGKSSSQENVPDTQIEWKRKIWNFGDISEGEIVTHTWYFKNSGEHSLVIKNIDTGCGCTTVTYDKKPIEPGKEVKIEIAFNSAGRYGKQYKEISIFANIPEKQTTLSFTANVK